MSIAPRPIKRKMRIPVSVLRGHRAIWGGKIPAGAMEQLRKEYAKPMKKKRNASKKRNAPKMKRSAPKGWVKATAVKIRRRGGRVEVLVRK